MEKVRLMRVFNPHRGQEQWVPRKLWEIGFRSGNILKEPQWIIDAVRLAELYNMAERRKRM